MLHRRRLIQLLPMLGLGPLLRAQEIATKPIRIICPFAPGGGSDFIARVGAQLLAKELGQAVLVENRPGAGGTIGTEYALSQAGDGLTLLLAAGSYTVNPALYKLRFDPVADMTPVVQLSKGAYVACVNAKLPFKNINELLSYARLNPGKLTFASAGNGSHLHIATEYLFGLAKVKATHIPYKGTGPAVNDLLAGNVDLFIAGTEALMQHVKTGRLRALGVTTSTRLNAYPEIPSISESGIHEYDVVAWHGLLAPKGVSTQTISKYNAALNKQLKTPELIAQLEPTGVSPAGGPSEKFGALIQSEIPRYAKVVRDNDIQSQ